MFKRPRLQFGLRTVIVLVTIACGLLARWVNRSHDQHVAADRFRRAGAQVIYRTDARDSPSAWNRAYRTLLDGWFPQDYFNDVVELDLAYTALTDDDFKSISSFRGLQRLSASRTHMTNARLKHFAGLSQLTDLNLDMTPISDDGLQDIGKLSSLRRLTLSHTFVTGNGLEHLHGLRNLEDLSLRGSPVTDAGLAGITRLPALKQLGLSETRVSDAAFEHLGQLGQLQSVTLWDTGATEAGKLRFRTTHPNCRVNIVPPKLNFR